MIKSPHEESYKLINRKIILNVATNYLSVIWIGALGLILMPVYFRSLGKVEWSLIAMCMTAQGVMAMLDLGLSQIMPREVAIVKEEDGGIERIHKLFLTIYSLLGGSIIVLTTIFLPIINRNWIEISGDLSDPKTYVILVASAQFAFQFCNAANNGIWNSLGKQVKSNFRQITFTTLRHILALSSMNVFGFSAINYIISFAFLSFVEFIVNYISIKKEFYINSAIKIKISDISHIINKTKSLSLSIVMGSLATQSDRFILSISIPRIEYGGYIVISTLGLSLIQIQYPFLKAFLPVIMSGKVSDDFTILKKMIGYIMLITVTPVSLICIMSEEILQIWLGEHKVPVGGEILLSLISISVAINAIYNAIYQFMVKNNFGVYIIFINFCMLISIFFTIYLTADLGIISGGLGWLMGSIIQLLCGIYWILRQKKINLLYN